MDRRFAVFGAVAARPILRAGAAAVMGIVVLSLAACHAHHHPDTSSVPSYAPFSQAAQDFAPNWSRDGRNLLYSQASGARGSLWTARAGESKGSEFLEDAGLGAWSPDGKSLAFSSGRRRAWYDVAAVLGRGGLHLWVSDAAGQHARKLTSSGGAELDAVWSPDGKRIAYTAFPGPRVAIVSSGGGDSVVFADGLSPAWSPDGKRIAYYVCESMLLGAHCRIAVRPVDGGAAKTLQCLALSLPALGRPSLEWSSDGKLLLTTAVEQGALNPVLLAVDEDRVERTIAVPGSVTHPRWAPDGERIAYSFTDTAHPATIEVLTLANGHRSQIASARTFAAAHLVYVKSGDLAIPSWLYLPRNAEGKHPAILWLHGGVPGTGSMPNQFEPTIQYFVENGFVVLAPNFRGSVGFGEQVEHPGQPDPLPDVAAAAAYLRTVGAVDPSRVALVGFSFGGFLTLRAITTMPDLVAAAVDFYGQSDLTAYYRHNPASRPLLNALLGGSPEQKPEVYRSLSPINLVDRIQVPVLALYGEHDPDYDEATALHQSLEKAHKNFEYISYRSAGHGFEGADDLDATQQAMRFLRAHLGGSP